jgi:hypothetical protein
MYDRFIREFRPDARDTLLDLGVTSDERFEMSNLVEALYPFKDRITAAGIDPGAAYLERDYPGLVFREADACDLPFRDGEFDLVYSSAVIEHVGGRDRQARMIAECTRVARRGIFLTTPNRWFPIELHTQLPFVHWLPAPAFRWLLRHLGHAALAQEEHLNLMAAGDIRRAWSSIEGWAFSVGRIRLMGPTSNLLIIGHREA